MPLAARLIALSTTLGGASVVLVSALAAPTLPGHVVALLAGAAILTELMQVHGDESSGAGEATTFSFSAGVLLAAVIVLGPLGGALIVPPALALVDELRGSPRRAIAFNAGGAAISALLAGAVYTLAGGEIGVVDLPRQAPQLALAALVAYAVNLLLVEGIVSALSGQSPRHRVVTTARAQVLSATSEAGFGIAFAYFVIKEPWAILTLAPLVVGVYKAHARLELQRRETTRALETFANVVDERDPFTSRHSLRVSETMRDFAEWLGRSPDEVARLRWAGRLHDLGKITVDSTILHKPARLNEDEWEAVRAHPRLSARLLRRFSLAGDEARAVELHHERFDGQGYYRVAPDRIPLAAHLLIVADSFDAITNDRPYRRGFSLDDALGEIERGSGTQFHPLVARAFVDFKRGLDRHEAIGPAELAALDALWRAEADPPAHRPWRPSATTVVVALTLGALASAVLGSAVGAATLGGGALAAGALAVAGREKARHLTDRLLRALADGDLEAAVRTLSATSPVVFAALVPPAPTEIVPLLGRADRNELFRDWLSAVAPDATVIAAGPTMGVEGFVAAVPVGEPGDRVHLVVQFASEPPPAVHRALSRSLAGFRSLSLDPLLAAPSEARLSAIA